MKKRIKVSESLPCGILLALSGGCMDAYSYIFRDHVFANAQTGNLLLFGVNLAGGNFSVALKYLWPILAFVAGIIIADQIGTLSNLKKFRWRQLSVFIELFVLILVAFIPKGTDSIANMLTSFACGIQVESFRKIHGYSVATTMCIGNLRSGTYNMDKYFATNDRTYLLQSLLYYGIIIMFVIGAILESFVLPFFGQYSILLSSMLLFIVALLMFRCTAKGISIFEE